jgi:DNA-binding protein H-NS
MAKDLERMSYRELQELVVRAQRAMVNVQNRERDGLRKKMEAMAKDAGFRLGDLVGGRGGKGRTVAIKYSNPDDPSQTWTGRGRKPKWLAAEIAKGARLERFLVR